jgi:hypothetical protein
MLVHAERLFRIAEKNSTSMFLNPDVTQNRNTPEETDAAKKLDFHVLSLSVK